MLETICAALLRFITWISKIIGPMYMFLGVLKPELPLFLSSLSYPAASVSLLERVAYILPLTYVTLTWWSNLLFVGSILSGYVFSTLVVIFNLRYRSPKPFQKF